ncbi:hypothetical protein SAMN04489867_0582 [Pedococcus dokdonensis]|uniref:Uncharacterized protein n=1 Tax=Pedococcus dokdonensis TaxID=443156 RepID=A0A1H0MEJ7_9MICO|nr:DUF5995 family protein [Pedococcus dokdonensis]SDO78686.1 hypothetical protein SAMN04489867_0582 [Pedococcus dokdonensis]
MTERDISTVVAAMDARLARMPPARRAQRTFLETYRRTTLAVGAAIEEGRFEDPEWVERWDVVFADLYLAALELDLVGSTTEVPRPWRLAFDAPASLPALRHVLLGINAHINYDLPQALLAVISDAEFADPLVMARRARDHERIDGILSGRVAAEDGALGGPRSLLDRVLQPLNRRGSRRFLREARQKVWHNTMELQHARVTGQEAYAARLAELEVLSAARIADLLAPGQVLLRLAVAGFGVTLPPP